MKKSLLKKVACLAMAGVALFGTSLAAGCSGGDANGGHKGYRNNKKYDATKTQINIHNYTAGYGDEWLYNLEDAFEAAYANTSFEEGKMGVQVWHTGKMETFTTVQIAQGNKDIYFMEQSQYPTYTDGTMEDLSSILTAELSDGKTIAAKMTAEQLSYFGVEKDGGTKYYALPHYVGNYGIIYNMDLFDEEGYYFDEGGELIMYSGSTTKSAGPDGVAGTYDDGLPSTYAQFYTLLGEIYANGDIPMIWTGEYYEQHLMGLYEGLVATYEGKDQMLLNYTFDGEAKNLGKVQGGKWVEDSTPTTITSSNGYEVARQSGKYYALEFLSTVMSNKNYYYTDSYNTSFSHTSAQRIFLQNGTSLQNGTKDIAMLVDGFWWQAEASGTFENMAKKDSKYSATNRKFGWMPMPYATESQIGNTQTITDFLSSLVCVKAGLDEGVKNAAFEFIKFLTTDDQLVEFTKTTGAIKGYDYTIPESVKSTLSTFTQTLIDYTENADIVYKYSSNSVFTSHTSYLSGLTEAYTAAVGGTTYKNPAKAIHEKGTSAIDYISAYITYLQSGSGITWG